ncbi:GLPGLI family protein [Chryseobacterium sp. ISL-6]|uniref:GLPGLI family protein n=1 Tax=Chryseobacterium sp. ISL-6 TaxID=2819143 RepID=UPI001BE68584|nr:GLPGLI family protein [Chryseobacterium sp. ISL-6]MBT2621617.1 GLPGLI family protein [Chryseobacterium sp. ISL-6]
MKKKLLVFFILFLLTMSYGQTIRYVYETSVNPDSINLVSLKFEKTFLDIKGNQSLFISEHKLVRDSLLTAFRKEEKNDSKKEGKDFTKFGFGKQSEQSFFEYFITKNISEQKVYYHDKIAGKQIYYQEDRPIKWQVTEETEQQNGYKAQKATANFGGRVWTGWFTKEINISDGPYKFSGLPGLIVKLEDDKGDYKFELVKKITIKNAFEESVSPDAKLSTRIDFMGDKAAIELSKDSRTMLRSRSGGDMNSGGGRRGGGMKGGSHGGGRGMSSRGMDSSNSNSIPTGDIESFHNDVKQNPIELK